MIITTQFNLGLYSRKLSELDGPREEQNARWLEERMELFTKYTFPSVAGQTDDNFHWILLVDKETPSPVIEELMELSLDFPQLRIYFLKKDGDLRLQTKITTEFHALTEGIGDNRITTVRLDSDDALALNYVETLRRTLDNIDTPDSASVLVNFNRGVVLDEKTGETLRWVHPRNMFIALDEPHGSTYKTVWNRGHNKWSSDDVDVMFNEDDLADMHLHVIHGGNRCDTMELVRRFPHEKYNGSLKERFGVVI